MQEQNILELKTINDLTLFSFFIPAYQRRYRWSEKEILDLIIDIYEFQPLPVADTKEKTWYCLQPIIIKKDNTKDNTYEVIDGQQRLTTIYLILDYLNQALVKPNKIFEIDYETRKGTGDLLNNLENESDDIDSYYIKRACDVISDWFERKEQSLKFNKNDFESNLKFNSKIIWYEITEEDPITIFTRINSGKIPLTNAELIKALFLNSANFDENQSELRLKQLEIAAEWDRMEQAFQNDGFWFFLTKNTKFVNRIELIFNLMTKDKNKDKDEYATFRHFNEEFNAEPQVSSHDKKKNIEKNWQKVKDYFQRFTEWHEERDLYHKIGYLITVTPTSIKYLYDKSRDLSKPAFKNHLNNLIRENFLSKEKWENLHYGQPGDNEKIKNVLLLYNIITILGKPHDNFYFPFNIYKEGNWDIEHIASKSPPTSRETREEWMTNVKVFIDTSQPELENLKSELERYLESESKKHKGFSDDKEFNKLFAKIVEHFSPGLVDDIDHISNLSLLNSETNRGYKNAAFPVKRKIIIDCDKKGRFIPICTKNVFLKYYSENSTNIFFWTQEDRKKYEEDINRVLEGYIK